MGSRKLVRSPSTRDKRQTQSKWTTWAIVGVLVVVFGALLAMVLMQSGSRAAPARPGGARTGEPAPDFTLRLLDGKTLTLSSLKGKAVLVNFWASG